MVGGSLREAAAADVQRRAPAAHSGGVSPAAEAPPSPANPQPAARCKAAAWGSPVPTACHSQSHRRGLFTQHGEPRSGSSAPGPPTMPRWPSLHALPAEPGGGGGIAARDGLAVLTGSADLTAFAPPRPPWPTAAVRGTLSAWSDSDTPGRFGVQRACLSRQPRAATDYSPTSTRQQALRGRGTPGGAQQSAPGCPTRLSPPPPDRVAHRPPAVATCRRDKSGTDDMALCLLECCQCC